MSLQGQTDKLVAIVRGVNGPLADQLASAIAAERAQWYYSLQRERAKQPAEKDLQMSPDKPE